MSIETLIVLISFISLFGFHAWHYRKSVRHDRWLREAMATPAKEPVPPMIFLTDEILEIHERYKALRSKDRFSSHDVTNDTGDELFYAVLDLIDPEYWKAFEIVPSHSTGDTP